MVWVHLYRFLNVGAVGFAIDAGMLWFLVYVLDVGAIPARALSFIVTISVTFVLNARYTFGVSVRGSSKSRYVAVQLLGAVINFVSYSVLVLSGPIAGRPLIALVIGSALASTHNFIMMRRFVFDHEANGSRHNPEMDAQESASNPAKDTPPRANQPSG